VIEILIDILPKFYYSYTKLFYETKTKIANKMYITIKKKSFPFLLIFNHKIIITKILKIIYNSFLNHYNLKSCLTSIFPKSPGGGYFKKIQKTRGGEYFKKIQKHGGGGFQKNSKTRGGISKNSKKTRGDFKKIQKPRGVF
jgi:hypothetical protein